MEASLEDLIFTDLKTSYKAIWFSCKKSSFSLLFLSFVSNKISKIDQNLLLGLA